MQDWLKLVFLVLVCYRLADLLAYDEGPFSVFKRLRVWLGAYDYGPNGEAQTILGRFVSCPYCLGVWIALPLAIWASLDYWWLWWFAIAGGQSFLQSMGNR